MKNLLFVGVFGLVAVLARGFLTPSESLPRSSPELQGISSAGLMPLIDEADEKALGLHGLVIVRHGHVVAEGWWAPYAATEPHMLFSLSKSFTSTAIGLLQAEGKLSIYDPVLKFFPEDAPAAPSENLRAMRVRDLLMMSTGQHQADVDQIKVMAADKSGTKQFLAAPVPHKPGTHFYYNSPATFMLSAIVQKVSGQTTRDYLNSRLFEPLGIPQPDWELTPQGINVGASGLYLRTEDIAKFGQLYLQRGEWQGRRLIPAAWIDEATARQTSNGSSPESDWDQGYGYQFWRCIPGFYRADGAFGQFCIVMPQYDTVVAINSGTSDMGAVMKLIWRRLLPELRAAALPENAADQTKLKARLAALSLPVPAGSTVSAAGTKAIGRRFIFAQSEANVMALESCVIESSDADTTVLVLKMHGTEQRIAVGHGRWLKGMSSMDRKAPVPSTASGGWTSDQTFAFQLCMYRSPFIINAQLQFSGDEVTLSYGQNVGFGPTKAPPLVGRAQ